MVTVQIKEAYAAALNPLEQSVEGVVRQLAIERAGERIAELRQALQQWEDKYQTPYDVFAYRAATDETFVAELDANPATQEWEADMLVWETQARELVAWHHRLQSILSA